MATFCNKASDRLDSGIKRVVTAQAGPHTCLQLPVTICNTQYKSVIDVGLPTSLISTVIWQKLNSPLFPIVSNEIAERVVRRTNLQLMGYTHFELKVGSTLLKLEDAIVYDYEEAEIFLSISAVSALGLIIDFQEGTFGLKSEDGLRCNWNDDTMLFPDSKLGNVKSYSGSLPSGGLGPGMFGPLPGAVGPAMVPIPSGMGSPTTLPRNVSTGQMKKKVVNLRKLKNFYLKHPEVPAPLDEASMKKHSQIANWKKPENAVKVNTSDVSSSPIVKNAVEVNMSDISSSPNVKNALIKENINVHYNIVTLVESTAPVKPRKPETKSEKPATGDQKSTEKVSCVKCNSNNHSTPDCKKDLKCTYCFAVGHSKSNCTSVLKTLNNYPETHSTTSKPEDPTTEKSPSTSDTSKSKAGTKDQKSSEKDQCTNCNSKDHSTHDCENMLKCTFCHVKGHLKADCPAAVKTVTLKCAYCHVVGHLKSACPATTKISDSGSTSLETLPSNTSSAVLPKLKALPSTSETSKSKAPKVPVSEDLPDTSETSKTKAEIASIVDSKSSAPAKRPAGGTVKVIVKKRIVVQDSGEPGTKKRIIKKIIRRVIRKPVAKGQATSEAKPTSAESTTPVTSQEKTDCAAVQAAEKDLSAKKENIEEMDIVQDSVTKSDVKTISVPKLGVDVSLNEPELGIVDPVQPINRTVTKKVIKLNMVTKPKPTSQPPDPQSEPEKSGVHIPVEKTDTPAVPGKVVASPVPGKVDASPVSGKVDTSPVPEKMDTSPVPGRVDASSVPGRVVASPVPGKVDVSPVPGKVDTSPVPEKMDTFPVPGKAAASSVPGKMDASPVPEKVDASPVPGKVDASPVPGKVDASPVPEKMDTSVPGKVAASPVPGKVDTSPVPGKSKASVVSKKSVASKVKKDIKLKVSKKSEKVEVLAPLENTDVQVALGTSVVSEKSDTSSVKLNVSNSKGTTEKPVPSSQSEKVDVFAPSENTDGKVEASASVVTKKSHTSSAKKDIKLNLKTKPTKTSEKVGTQSQSEDVAMSEKLGVQKSTKKIIKKNPGSKSKPTSASKKSDVSESRKLKATSETSAASNVSEVSKDTPDTNA